MGWAPDALIPNFSWVSRGPRSRGNSYGFPGGPQKLLKQLQSDRPLQHLDESRC